MSNIDKQEIQDWINFLYQDLLKDNIFIGGYFFSFSQLPEFEKLQSKITKKICSPSQLSKINKKIACSASERAQNEDLDALETIIVKLTAKDKFNKQIIIPCTNDEFYFVYLDLQKAKSQVEHFKDYLLQELEETKEEDYDAYMQFINDFLQDIRNQFSGISSNIK